MKPDAFETIEEIESVIKAQAEQARSACFIIGIDGFLKAGKSTLAKSLERKLNGKLIKLDAYIDPDVGSEDYISTLKLNDLAKDLKEANKHLYPYVIIEGICLLDVLKKISEQVDVLVYVKRLSGENIWNDEIELEHFEQGKIKRFDVLEECVFVYHTKYIPHKKADILFKRKE